MQLWFLKNLQSIKLKDRTKSWGDIVFNLILVLSLPTIIP